MNINLFEADITTLRNLLITRQITSKELVLSFLERIAEYDKGDGGLNSVIEINPDAVFIAEALDEDIKNNRIKGPLHGIPILVKR